MFVFHHIPRTGGQAVIANLTYCNPEFRFCPRYDLFVRDGTEPYPYEAWDVLYGHFAYDKIPPGALCFTFARHPISRFSSCFYALRHVLRKQGITSIQELKAPSVRLGFAGGSSREFPRESVWFLDRIEDFIDVFLRTRGTFGMGFIPEIFEPDYRKDYDFIGLTERMNRSMVGLGNLMKTKPSRMTVLDASGSGAIHYRLRELTEFYGESIEVWERLCRAM
jgi:hypothetical protein